MPTVSTTIANPGFEDGDTGWTKSGGWTISTGGATFAGAWAAHIDTDVTGSSEANSDIVNENCSTVASGKTITVTGRCWGVGRDGNIAAVILRWLDASFAVLRTDVGNFSNWGSHGAWDISTVTGSAPAGALYAQVGFRGTTAENGAIGVDEISWDYVNDQSVSLTSPSDGATYVENESVLLAVAITGTSPTPTSVTYKDGATTIATTNSSPFSYNVTDLAIGVHSITAEVTFSDSSVLTTSAASIEITATPPVVTEKEYKASNAYTYLIGSSFSGLSAAMPSVALVTAAELVVDYKIQVLVRSKDLAITDPAGSNPNVVFDAIDNGTLEAILLEQNGSSYTTVGSAINADVPLILSDFDIIETGISEEKKWTVFESSAFTATLGSDASLFGLDPVSVADFVTRSVGFKFTPVLGTKPSYADSGDACIRFQIDKIRMRVYFDAGSAEYYFASPDKTQVIQGHLVDASVESGNLATSDATGVLQLEAELIIKDGTQTYIGDDWTIHAAYPPTSANQIGTVAARTAADSVGMSYNGLPSQGAIVDNRSRYVFITANFYGDEDLAAIYGVNGVGRAFAYNGDFFYYIQDHPDATKDRPRHVAYHHGHLALGYKESRVDISVIGKPYSFDGLLGASSWATSDAVTGLIPLSGTILGAFCQNSVWGISGTTVDNFATQIISPKMGAIEYTVTDMGFPVYANAYGVYTLSQTQEYGDFLGTPMSQDISPWLRPRLIRKNTSNKEVVVAWPVRAKNQYKIAFADGYVMSMTINAGMQSAPTFSFQKYDIYTDEELQLND